MSQGLSEETWRRLRQEARREANSASLQEAERGIREAIEAADLTFLSQVEQRLDRLSESWSIHRRPLLTRIPLLGTLFTWVSTRVYKFFLQNQIAFNAEVTRTLQDLSEVQRLLAKEQIARTDDLFSRVEEAVLALEARLRDLEEEVEQIRQQER
jgi:hypothetical protein